MDHAWVTEDEFGPTSRRFHETVIRNLASMKGPFTRKFVFVSRVVKTHNFTLVCYPQVHQDIVDDAMVSEVKLTPSLRIVCTSGAQFTIIL